MKMAIFHVQILTRHVCAYRAHNLYSPSLRKTFPRRLDDGTR